MSVVFPCGAGRGLVAVLSHGAVWKCFAPLLCVWRVIVSRQEFLECPGMGSAGTQQNQLVLWGSSSCRAF